MDICEYCKKRKKRYRVAFGSWICDSCKRETMNYQDTSSGLAINLNNWWNTLNLKEKEKIKEIYSKSEHLSDLSTHDNLDTSSTNIEKPHPQDDMAK